MHWHKSPLSFLTWDEHMHILLLDAPQSWGNQEATQHEWWGWKTERIQKIVIWMACLVLKPYQIVLSIRPNYLHSLLM